MNVQVEQKFNAGDQVELVSGGPAMTVEFYTGRGHVSCSWFEGYNRKKDTFVQDALKRYENPNVGI